MIWSVSDLSGSELNLSKDRDIWFDHKISFSLVDTKSNYHLELEAQEYSVLVASRLVSSASEPKEQKIQQASRVPSL